MDAPAAAPSGGKVSSKTVAEAFVLQHRQFLLPRLDGPVPPSTAKKVAKKVVWWVGLLACNFFWACCCCRNLQMQVRGLLMLTTVETFAGFAYSGNLMATALNMEEEVDTAVYYIAVMIFVLSAGLWVFVLSSIRCAHPRSAHLRPRTPLATPAPGFVAADPQPLVPDAPLPPPLSSAQQPRSLLSRSPAHPFHPAPSPPSPCAPRASRCPLAPLPAPPHARSLTALSLAPPPTPLPHPARPRSS